MAGPAETKESWAGPAETKESWAGPAETKESWAGPAGERTLRAPGTERPLERTLRAKGIGWSPPLCVASGGLGQLCPTAVPSWDLSVVPEGLVTAPFEPLESAPERILTLKVTVLLALTEELEICRPSLSVRCAWTLPRV